MDGTITMDATSGDNSRTGNWATRGAMAAGRGMVLFGFTLVGLMLLTGLLTAVALIPLGVGLPVTAATLRAMRGLEAKAGRRTADRRTWRSLLWITVDILAGWLFTLTPAGLIAWGMFGVVMPAVWRPIVTAHGNNWYAFIHVTTASTAWLSAALGIAFIALGLLTAPWFLRHYAALARSVQAGA